jgi:hypothetical protein
MIYEATNLIKYIYYISIQNLCRFERFVAIEILTKNTLNFLNSNVNKIH